MVLLSETFSAKTTLKKNHCLRKAVRDVIRFLFGSLLGSAIGQSQAAFNADVGVC